MRQLISGTALCIIVFLLLSFSGERQWRFSVDHWELYTSKRELASGGDAMTTVISNKELSSNDSISFYYRPCARTDAKRLTQLFLETSKGKTLVSSERSIDYYTGKFSMKKLKEIAAHFHTDSLVLVAKMEPNWTEKFVIIKLEP